MRFGITLCYDASQKYKVGCMPIGLIATDIDGTLLNSENMLPPANLRALERAQARGVRLALVTARKVASTQRIAKLIGLPCALVTHNGARTWDWEGHELRHLTLPLPLAEQIANFADEHEIPLVMTINERNYFGPGYPLSPSLNGDTQADVRVPTNRAALVGPPTRIIAVGERPIDLLHTAFAAAADTLVLHRYYSRVGALHSAVLTHPRANKADALAELCDHVHISANTVLALGDAEADAPMLGWAGVGVAMGNGMPEARAAADWIAPSHDDAGFATAVERFVLDATQQRVEHGLE